MSFALGGGTAGASFRRLRVNFDWPLVLATLLICAIGLTNLYSATLHAPRKGLFSAQLSWMVLGAGLFVAAALLDYRLWMRLAWWGLLVGLVMVMAVHFTGPTVKGSRRWLGVGGVGIQPSEFIKLAVILALARLVHDRGSGEMAPWELGLRMLALGGAILLIAWQPDLGTATLVALVCLSVAFVAARRLWPIWSGLLALAAAVPLLWAYVLHDYQKRRVLTFMDPSTDPTGAGWHARQSIMAVGSGRWGGKGFLEGTQNQLNFLPEHWSDFPFSVWAEEWGFVGSMALLLLYAFLILWTLHVATKARDRFGAILCVGVAAMLFWHVFVNIAMVTGLAPVVGVTLPLVSHGGSSVLTVWLGLGLVASVSMRRFAR
jgi:rod shape determining protein RodA